MDNSGIRILLISNDESLRNSVVAAFAGDAAVNVRCTADTAGLTAALLDPPADIALIDVTSLSNEAIRDAMQTIRSAPAAADILALASTETMGQLPHALQCGATDAALRESMLGEAGQAILRHRMERMTAQLAIAQGLRRRNSLLEAAVANLAGGIAHEFNNALQTILGYTKAVIQELPPDSRPWHDLNEVMIAGDRAAKLTRQLLTFSRRQTPKFTPVDVSMIIASAVHMLRPVLGAGISIETIYHSRQAIIDADPGMIEQALLQLCLNARDAMPDGGRIVIQTVDIQPSDNDVARINGLEPGSYVRISLSDTGAGMTPEVCDRAFEPFFSTKAPGEGSGLGLATVHGIVQQHRGAIDLVSEPGIGTIFHIYLRPYRPPPASTAPAVDSVSTAAIHGRAILLADDQEAIRGLATRILETAGYTVYAAADGRQAIDAFDCHAGEIGLALLDAIMPHGDGWSVAARLRERNPQLPVLVVTGYDSPKQKTINGQSVEVLEKPFSPDELLNAVKKSLNGAK